MKIILKLSQAQTKDYYVFEQKHTHGVIFSKIKYDAKIKSATTFNLVNIILILSIVIYIIYTYIIPTII